MRAAIVLLFALVLGSCWDPCERTCCPTGVVIDARELHFEGAPCEGESCSVTIVGSTATVPSLLPGDHALALDPGASVAWTWMLAGAGTGTSIAMSFRCDEGGDLRFVANGFDAVRMGATRDWRRQLWPLVPPSGTFTSVEAARMGRFTTTLRVENAGRARCALDWVRTVAAARVCSGLRTACDRSAFGPPLSVCDGVCVDTSSDPSHCGGCDLPCGSGSRCVAGACVGPDDGCSGGCAQRECGSNRCGTASCGDCGPDRYCLQTGDTTTCAERAADAGRTDVIVRDAGPPVPPVLGQRCDDDSQCRHPTADLVCADSPGGRVCTSRVACDPLRFTPPCLGLGSTCVVADPFGSPPTGLCTRSCVPSQSADAGLACPGGGVCTANLLNLPIDRFNLPGCVAFCHDDPDCAGATPDGGTSRDGGTPFCNRHTGRCVASPPSALAGADGTACDPTRAAAGDNPCRGLCLGIRGAPAAHGLCASLVDLRTTRTCAGARVQLVTASRDDLGVCMVARCDDNRECGPGLVCVHPEDDTTPLGVRTDLPATCGYATTRQPVGRPYDGGVAVDGGMDASVMD